MAIPIRTIDHVVVMAADIEKSIVFYCDVLGGKPRYLQPFRDGKFPVLAVELGGAVVNLQRLDEPEHLALHGDVEGGRRFVGDDQLGLAGKGDGDQHALAHAAGQLVRVLPQHALGRADMDVVQ